MSTSEAALPLVVIEFERPGLREAIGLAPHCFLEAGDEHDAATRAGARVLVTQGAARLSTGLVDSFPNLTHIVAFGAGHDGVDADHAARRGISVLSSIGANAPDVAEIAVGLLISVVRRMPDGDALVRSGHWTVGSIARTPSIGSLRVGIVGLGAIGQAIAERLTPFGCAIRWWGPRPKDVAWPRADSLFDLARESNVLIVAAHLSAETDLLIDAGVLDALGADGYVVNIARGRLIDEDALIAALREGRLAGAGLDVFWNEPPAGERWRDVPNTVLAPHMGSVTYEAIPRIIEAAAANVRRALAASGS